MNRSSWIIVVVAVAIVGVVLWLSRRSAAASGPVNNGIRSSNPVAAAMSDGLARAFPPSAPISPPPVKNRSTGKTAADVGVAVGCTAYSGGAAAPLCAAAAPIVTNAAVDIYGKGKSVLKSIGGLFS